MDEDVAASDFAQKNAFCYFVKVLLAVGAPSFRMIHAGTSTTLLVLLPYYCTQNMLQCPIVVGML